MFLRILREAESNTTVATQNKTSNRGASVVTPVPPLSSLNSLNALSISPRTAATRIQRSFRTRVASSASSSEPSSSQNYAVSSNDPRMSIPDSTANNTGGVKRVVSFGNMLDTEGSVGSLSPFARTGLRDGADGYISPPSPTRSRSFGISSPDNRTRQQSSENLNISYNQQSSSPKISKQSSKHLVSGSPGSNYSLSSNENLRDSFSSTASPQRSQTQLHSNINNNRDSLSVSFGSQDISSYKAPLAVYMARAIESVATSVSQQAMLRAGELSRSAISPFVQNAIEAVKSGRGTFNKV